MILQTKPTVLLTSARVDCLDPNREQNNGQDGLAQALTILLWLLCIKTDYFIV